MILKDDNIPRNCWKLARVAETYPDEDSLLRKVKVVVANQSGDSDGSRLKVTPNLGRLLLPKFGCFFFGPSYS